MDMLPLLSSQFLYSQDLSNCTTDIPEPKRDERFCTLKI